ncbi:transglutaminase TgpA family protein [Noviherbaspirillum sp. ST9]|uniref:transglutaminase TgpA family protein n=1 Tax=Noviherbaspirillum sp. ST9 TaxID=3401606 RepID=UPI003B586C2F
MKLPFFGRPAPLGNRPMSRDKADILLLLFACTLVLLPHASHLPVWITPVCAALLGWRGWITFRGNRLPPRWLLLPVAALAMGGVYLTFRTFFGREAGVSMLALLLTLKLLEMHAKRDLFVALFLSFFLILSSFFYSQSIGTALLTLAAVVAILTTQVSFQFTGAVPPLKQRLRMGATILLLAGPVTLVLFLLFPRIQGPLWGMPGDAHSGRTGMSDTMEPGNIQSLAQSDEIAFRVKFTGSPPPKAQLYWRGPVLSGFDGRKWFPQRRQTPGTTSVNLQGEALNYQVTLEPHGKRWLFALDIPRAVPLIEQNPARITYDMQLLASQGVHERLRYDAASHLQYELNPNETPASLQQWLDLPPGFNPRAMVFASDLRRKAQSSADLVSAVLRHFRTEAFRYTLQPPLLGRDHVDDFLFTTRAGFCEHYSSAFVVLMRAAGIPARVVTGYQGGELNAADGFLVVRQSDAHAWAEVWLEKRGWVRIDPTSAVAPERVEGNLASAIPRQILGGLITLDASNNALFAQLQKIRQNWDAVSNAWNQWVLNYTPQQQRNFIKSLGFEDVDWRTMATLLLVFGSLAVAIVVLPLLFHETKRDPVEAIYLSLCRRLAKKGFPRELHEGPRSYRARLTSAESPLPQNQKAALARFLELYETVRYDATDLARPTAVARLKSLSAECR